MISKRIKELANALDEEWAAWNAMENRPLNPPVLFLSAVGDLLRGVKNEAGSPDRDDCPPTPPEDVPEEEIRDALSQEIKRLTEELIDRDLTIVRLAGMLTKGND
jgi:hypothetical protein